MKTKLFILTAMTGILMGCKPGPVSLNNPFIWEDSQKTAVVVKNSREQTPPVTYHMDKARVLTIPKSTGSELITNKVRAAFAQDPALNSYHIQIETHHNVVKLSGQVPNAQAKRYAIKVARFTKGVLAVDAKDLVVTQ